MPRKSSKVAPCELCGRVLPLTFHHLIPRRCHRLTAFKKKYTKAELNHGIDVCRDCHDAIHTHIPDEKELGRKFNTKALLLTHPKLEKYVQWIIRRQPDKRVRTRNN